MGDASHAELLRLQAELAGTATDPPRGAFAPDPAEAPDAGAEARGAGFPPPPGTPGLIGRLCAGVESVRARVRRQPLAGVAVSALAGTVASIVLLRPNPPPRPENRKSAAAERPRAGGNVR